MAAFWGAPRTPPDDGELRSKPNKGPRWGIEDSCIGSGRLRTSVRTDSALAPIVKVVFTKRILSPLENRNEQLIEQVTRHAELTVQLESGIWRPESATHLPGHLCPASLTFSMPPKPKMSSYRKESWKSVPKTESRRTEGEQTCQSRRLSIPLAWCPIRWSYLYVHVI